MEVGFDLTLVLSFLRCLLDALKSQALLNLNLGLLAASQKSVQLWSHFFALQN